MCRIPITQLIFFSNKTCKNYHIFHLKFQNQLSCSSDFSVTSTKHICIYTSIKLILIILRPPGVADCAEVRQPHGLCAWVLRNPAGNAVLLLTFLGKVYGKKESENTSRFLLYRAFFSRFEHIFCQTLRTPCKVSELWVVQDISASAVKSTQRMKKKIHIPW